MLIYIIKKEKGRIYKSEDIVRALFGMELSHDEDGAPCFAGSTQNSSTTGSTQNSSATSYIQNGSAVGFARERSAASIAQNSNAAGYIQNGTVQDLSAIGPEGRASFISISDTKNYWGCAVDSVPVGFDIEEQNRVIKPSIVKRFHKAEKDYLSVLSEGSREWTEEFLSIWTRKEAYMKLRGEGLRMGLSSFSVIDNDKMFSFPFKRLIVGIAFGEAVSDQKLLSGVRLKEDCKAPALLSDVVIISSETKSFGEIEVEISIAEYNAPFEVSCLDAAAGMLDVRAYSAAELKKKLADKKYPIEEIDAAIEKLKGYGYLNDEAYAKQLGEKIYSSGKVGKRMELELIKKGIEKPLAKQIVSSYTENSREKALEIAGKMPHENDKEKAKIARKLASLGYEASIIYGILNELN